MASDGVALTELESRLMLAGDHPNLPVPWSPSPPATVLNPDTVNPAPTPLRGRAQANGMITAGDPGDLFTFVVPATGSRTKDFITVLADTVGPGSTLDTFVEVYNSSGQLIATGANNGNLSIGLNSLLPVAQRTPDGWVGFEGTVGETYFIHVKADPNPVSGRTTTGNYTVKIDAATVEQTTNADPDVDLGGGQTAPNIDFGRAFAADTLTERQEDIVYRVTTPNDAKFDSLATFSAISDDNTILNPHIDVYSTGNAQGVVTRLAGDTDAGRQTDAFTVYRTEKNTTYYIRVRADDLRAAPTGQSAGLYQMIARFAASDVPLSEETRRGQTGAVVTAGDDPMTPWTQGVLHNTAGMRQGVDSQLFRFTAQGTGLGIVTVIAQQTARGMEMLGALPQPALRFYDSTGAFIDFNKGNGSAQLLLPVTGDQSYFLVIEGFDNASDGGFQIFIEGNHTNDPSQGVDDHINTPNTGSIPAWQLATPLRFNAAFQPNDNEGNPARDRTWLQTANATGRIQGSGDTDLFQFVAPVNQLSTYGGNDGNQGSAIYVGGNFATAGVDPRTGLPYDSNNLGIFDGNGWFLAGSATEAAGAFDGPIFASAVWDPDGGGPSLPVLAVGGRFTMLNGQPAGNLAFRVFSAQLGAYVWSTDPLSPTSDNPLTTNGTVFALGAGDVIPVELQGAEGAELYVGGQFTNAGGPGVQNIVGFANVGGAIGRTTMGGGVNGGTNPGVFAITFWDPPAPPAFTLPAGSSQQVPPQEPDLPLQVYFGGRFTSIVAPAVPGGLGAVERTSAGNIARFGLNGNTTTPAFEVRALPNSFNIVLGTGMPGTATPTSFGVTVTATGSVNALAVWDDPGEFTNNGAAAPTDIPQRLIIGGNFTRATGTTPATNLVAYDYTIVTDTTPGTLRRFINIGSITPTVRTLASWLAPETATSGNIQTGMQPVLVIGGDGASNDATTGALNLIVTAGQAPIAFAAADDGTIRTVMTFEDDEIGYAPGTNPDGTPARFQTLHIGGDFTMIDGQEGFNHVARLRLDLPVPGFNWEGFREGTDGVSDGEVPGTVSGVYTLSAFDDDIALIWDRNERAGTRVSLILAGTDGHRISDATIRVFDSNFNLVWWNTTLDPTGQNDVPGSNDPSLTPLFQNAQTDPAWQQTGAPFPGFTVWAGEVYYVEVGAAVAQDGTIAASGTGRYNLSVTTDAVPPRPDPAQDTLGSFPDEISGYNTPVGAGQFADAPEIQLGGDGKGRPFRNPLDPNNPAAYTTRGFRGTPGGIGRVEFSDSPTISRVTDTHLFQFRASNDGTVEIRLSTLGIFRSYQEQVTDVATGQTNVFPRAKQINSPLHGALRVFNNDQQQIAYNNGSQAVNGFLDGFQTFTPGAADPSGANNLNNLTETGVRFYTHSDPRIVVNVRRGNVYFIQVESAFLGAFQQNPDLVDWRFATGGYDLIVSATPSLGGLDDHWPNFDAGPTPIDGQNGTVIPIDSVTGAGTINGQIQNIPTGPFANPQDNDSFIFIAEGRGNVQLTLTPTDPTLAPRVRVFDDTLNVVTTGSGGAGQTVNVQFPVEQGKRFFIVVDAGTTQGRYTMNLATPVQADDYPLSDAVPNDINNPVGGWNNAHGLQLNRFLGLYGEPTGVNNTVAPLLGTIENPDDRDIFRFTAESYEIATATLTRIDSTLDPLVLVYEVNKDGANNDVFLLIGINDDISGTDVNSRVSFSTTAGRDYYVVVMGSNLNTSFGRYSLSVNVTPTDDHPNSTDFPLGTVVNIVFDNINFTGAGNSTGKVERTGDTDLFRFTAPATGAATVTLNRAVGSTLGVSLTVLDNNNVPLAGVTFTTTADGIVATLPTILQNVQYYLLVQAATPLPIGTTDTGDYTLAVATTPVDDYPNEGDFVSAHNITLSTTNGVGTRNGLLVPVGDTDLFKFSALAAGSVVVRVTTPGSSLNPTIRIYGSDTSFLFEANGNGDSAVVTFNATSVGQLFYVLVAAAPGTMGATAAGAYTLTITGTLPGGGGGPGGPDDFPNAGEWNDAATIGLDPRTGGGTQNAIINYAGDTDLFQFTSAGAGRVQLQLVTPQGGLVDGQLKVYNASRTLIASDAAGIPGAPAAITFDATAGGQYFVLVEPIGAATGSYSVKLDTQPLTHFLYFPEGFAGSNIDEFVPMVNTNGFDVDFEIYARYETGANPNTPIYTGTIGANSRGGVTIATRNNLAGALVRIGVPYALEIRSTAKLGATFSHYDFSSAVGEAFTRNTSTTWTFAEANKDASVYRDFLLFYNPTNTTANLTVTIYYTDGATATFNQSVDSLRRGGININTDGRIFKNGTFGIKVTSDQPIVSSLTSYNLQRTGGDGLLGDSNGGATRGVVTNVQSGAGTTSNIAFLNTNSTPVTVTFTANYARLDIPNLVKVITIQPNRSYSADLAGLGMLAGQTAGLTYTSNLPVTFAAKEYKFGDGNTTTTSTAAGREFFFGDLFVNPALAGVKYIEQLGLYNPTATPITVDIRYLFTDGTSSTVNVQVGALTFAFVQIDQQQAILSRGGPTAFSLQLNSASPFVASLTHYDLFLNGGWSAEGASTGLTNPLTTI